MKTSKNGFYGARKVILGMTMMAALILVIIVSAIVHPFSKKKSEKLIDITVKKLEPYKEYLTGSMKE